MDIRIFKPLGRVTAALEFWEGDSLLAEVFARDDGIRRLYLSKEAAAWGLNWEAFTALVPEASTRLDQADDEMRQARQSFGED